MPSRLRCFTISQVQFNLTSQFSRAEKTVPDKDRDPGLTLPFRVTKISSTAKQGRGNIDHFSI